MSIAQYFHNVTKIEIQEPRLLLDSNSFTRKFTFTTKSGEEVEVFAFADTPEALEIKES